MEQSKILVAQSMAFLAPSGDGTGGYDNFAGKSFVMHLEEEEQTQQGHYGYSDENKYVGAAAVPKKNLAYGDLSPALFVSQAPDTQAAPTGRKRALLVGINYIGQSKELNGCVDDVLRMKTLLTTVYGFPDDPAFLTVMTDQAGTDPRLLPNKSRVLSAMKWLVKDAQAGDVLFFQYSGHGGQKKDMSGTEIDGFDETIMPLDYRKAGHITDDELHRVMIKDLQSGVKLICVMDCCHSGSGMDLPFYWDRERGKWEEEAFPKYSEGDVQLLSSCQDSQTAADLMIPSWGAGGAVTLALVTALSQRPFDLSFKDVLESLRKFLAEKRFSQIPQLSSTQRFDISRLKFNMTDIVHNTNTFVGRGKRGAQSPSPMSPQYLQTPQYQPAYHQTHGYPPQQQNYQQQDYQQQAYPQKQYPEQDYRQQAPPPPMVYNRDTTTYNTGAHGYHQKHSNSTGYRN